MKSKELKKTDADVGNTNKWVLPKSGSPRTIGMLPRAVGFSGCLPVLDVNNVPEKVPGLLGRKEKWELKQCSAMRPIKLNFGQNNMCKQSRFDYSKLLRTNAAMYFSSFAE
ncbi:hypothetical protein D8674_021830 [Pyrus ussuriensis x Pyrus communis]|uniref:Uncharacterized protein n=1 Tax=Pyrus ussuriensis x Pyrus communis TaxID=2448454 RepID=A0A5N5GNN5_9ROSA|nr:hypothetical protein D8674_021830 [Pyrus ussuriensis x Pyrus communis]